MEPPWDEEAPFDEHATLEELERVREQIQAYRAQRRAVQDEFGRFVRSFKEPRPLTAADEAALNQFPATEAPPAERLSDGVRPASAPPAGPAPDAPVPPPAVTPAVLQLPAPEPPPAAVLPPSPAVIPSPEAAGPAAPQIALASKTPVLAGAAALLVVLVVAAWMFRSGPDDPPADARSQESAERAAVEPPAAMSAPAVPTAPATSATELHTVRRVWLRVLVDGERVVEREVPADTRIPLDARESIVIRTGDAGAVNLRIAGEDQGFLGSEGQVLTRTFAVPPRTGAR